MKQLLAISVWLCVYLPAVADTVVWKGDAQPIAQVTTLTAGGTIETSDLFKITIGSKTLTVTAGSTTAATVATNVVTAFNALNPTLYPEFSGSITAAATSGGTLTLTAKTAGVPFTVALTTTEANGDAADAQTWGQTATTAADGGAFWSTAANWSTGAVPVDGDDVIFQNSANPCLYGLDAAGTDLTSLTIDQSFTGTIGLPRTNAAGYTEYREQYLKLTATTITIGAGGGSGSGRIKINTQAAQTTINVLNSGTATEQNVKAIVWKGTHASNTVNVSKGSFAAANFAGETATIATLKVGYRDNVASDSDVRLGSGCSLTTITKMGGILEINSDLTTLTNNAGETTINGPASVSPATINVFGGAVRYKCAGGCTTATVGSGGELDFRQDLQAVALGTLNMRAGGIVRDPAKRVTFTNPISLTCELQDVTLDLGNTFSLQRS